MIFQVFYFPHELSGLFLIRFFDSTFKKELMKKSYQNFSKWLPARIKRMYDLKKPIRHDFLEIIWLHFSSFIFLLVISEMFHDFKVSFVHTVRQHLVLKIYSWEPFLNCFLSSKLRSGFWGNMERVSKYRGFFRTLLVIVKYFRKKSSIIDAWPDSKYASVNSKLYLFEDNKF